MKKILFVLFFTNFLRAWDICLQPFPVEKPDVIFCLNYEQGGSRVAGRVFRNVVIKDRPVLDKVPSGRINGRPFYNRALL